MLRITPTLSIDEREIHFDFVRASGPGGQNVNKVATAVQLRFDVARANLPEDIRGRLIRLAGSRMTDKGVLLIDARRFRTQERNRQDALERLIALIREASEKPRRRIKTRPTLASRRRRLETKHHRAETKRTRRSVKSLGD